VIPQLTEELQAECEAMLQLCRDLRQLKPDVEVEHHHTWDWSRGAPHGASGCGCPWLLDPETGLLDERRHRNLNSMAVMDRCIVTSGYDTDYPFFICAHCKKLVPWCYGCDSDDPYLAACCDGCWAILTADSV
jgi:hypothetical protein